MRDDTTFHAARNARGRWVTALMVMAVVAAGVGVVVIDPFRSSGTGSRGVTDNSSPTSTVAVRRQTISQQTSVPATLGYAGSYSVINQAAGTYTALPAVGQVISQGKVLYRVNGSPIVLLYGSTPAYRNLSVGSTGVDVTQLNADLVAMGYATGSELSATSDSFGYWTEVGVERLQAALGETQNGTLGLGQAVFVASSLRVTAVSAQLGGPAVGGQPAVEGTSTTRQVTIHLDAGLQSEVKVGDRVTITLPDNTTTPGSVSQVGSVATNPSAAGQSGGESGTPTVTVEVTPTDPNATGSLDQAPVSVSITNATAADALVVPIDALVALSGGGYAIEVVDPAGIHHLIDVSAGIFDDADNLVQVTGPGLAAGERVVVPST